MFTRLLTSMLVALSPSIGMCTENNITPVGEIRLENWRSLDGIVFSPDSRQIAFVGASASDSGTLRQAIEVREVNGLSTTATYPAGDLVREQVALAFSQDLTRLFAISRSEMSSTVLEFAPPEFPIITLPTRKNFIYFDAVQGVDAAYAVGILQDTGESGELIAMNLQNGAVTIFPCDPGTLASTEVSHGLSLIATCNGVSAVRDKPIVVSVVSLQLPASMARQQSYDIPFGSNIPVEMGFSWNDSLLAIVDNAGKLAIHDVRKKQRVAGCRISDSPIAGCQLAYSSDDKILAIAFSNAVEFRSTKDGERIHRMECETQTDTAVTSSQRNNFFATIDKNKITGRILLRLWTYKSEAGVVAH